MSLAGVVVVVAFLVGLGHDAIAVGSGGCEDPVVREQVDAGPRDERGETLDQGHGFEEDPGGAVGGLLKSYRRGAA